jgi:hypothetical protein
VIQLLDSVDQEIALLLADCCEIAANSVSEHGCFLLGIASIRERRCPGRIDLEVKTPAKEFSWRIVFLDD